MVSAYYASDYDDLLKSDQWKNNLSDLNQYLVSCLSQAGEAAVLNGNLFYGHLLKDFHTQPLDERFATKRKNFFELACRSTQMLEVGVNGGHSMLLALMANPDLKCIGIDVCQQLGRRWARVDLYVPAAFNWLRYKFGNRVELIKGNSLIELPKYQMDHPGAAIDLLHLDGAKNTHLREFLAIREIMPSGGFIVHDDINLRRVRVADRQLQKIGLTKPVDYGPIGLEDCVYHVVRAKV